MKANYYIFLFILLLSCTKEKQPQIEVLRIEPSSQNFEENNLSVSNIISVVLSSSENFEAINEKMSFGFVAVEKREDFELPQEELGKKHLIFEVISLKKIEANRYQFFVNSALLPTNKTVFCRLERPGFVLEDGYHSPIFELKIQ